MRFDVALVNGGCLEIFFDDLVGFRKARSDVANFEGQNLGDIGRLRGRRFDAARDHVLEQQGRIVRHGVVHIDDIRQCFVVHLNQCAGSGGCRRVRRGHSGDGMSFIERLFARQNITCNMPEISRSAFRPNIGKILVRKINRLHYSLDTGQGFGL